MFQNQSALTVDNLKGYAAQLNLDRQVQRVPGLGEDGGSSGSRHGSRGEGRPDAGLTRFGTPAFFINGNNLQGAQPYDVFKAAIDAALAAAQ